jgi:chromate transporter
VALIAAPVFRLARTAGIGWRTAWIPLLSTLLIWALGVNPIFVILAAVVLGVIFKLKTKK